MGPIGTSVTRSTRSGAISDATSERVTKLERELRSLRGSGAPSGGQVSYVGAGNPPAPVSPRSGEGTYHRRRARPDLE